MRPLTVLHTSDWHLGHQLYKKRRDEEFAAFLNWLLETMRQKEVDVLIVAGDIFDTGIPGAQAQKMYYDFLGALARHGPRHVIITAGNHDSPSFLSAPKDLLHGLRIHVIGSATDNPEDELLILENEKGEANLIVCAVPYLRERDVRDSAPGEDWDEKNRKLLAGIAGHYHLLADLAEKSRQQYGGHIPVIATGHLFAAGDSISATDGERELYMGSLGRIPVDVFPNVFDYVALGHIHRPMAVGSRENCRYSGSPLPMSFGEAGQHKEVVITRWSGREFQMERLPVPCFRQLKSLRGSRRTILATLADLCAQTPADSQGIWLEIQHDGSDLPEDINQLCHDMVAGTPLEILCVKTSPPEGAPTILDLDGGLDDVSPEDIFMNCMEYNKVPEQEKDSLLASFRELLAEYQELGTGD